MAEPYKDERKRQAKVSTATGIALTLTVHVAIIVFGSMSGLKYLYPPPQEQAMLIDFSEAEPFIPEQETTGTEPRAAEADMEQDVKLVQASQAQHEGSQANEAPEAVNDDFGDVETPQPPREKEIDRRALFHAADNKTEKDTLAAQTAATVSNALKAGHAQGNTESGNTEGAPNAHLIGRKVLGTLPKPSYTVGQAGKVVVAIQVDQYGKVLEAVPGIEGTTVTDRTLWEAAKKAALEARFNMSSDAPAVQKGTITYIFNLTKRDDRK